MDPSPAPSPITTAGVAVDSSPSPSPSPSPPGPKLRMMCSYGGHIVPRPTDKTLYYAGGDTRLLAIDRRTPLSLSTLTSHLSKSLLNGRPFCLKYQLPNHDLDSLISITTDEDLANMIEEYDRLVSAASPSRLRFFLFPSRSAAAADLHDPTSEDWFIDALTNSGVVGGGGGGGGAVVDSGSSLPESIVLEKNSSYGSTSSSASTSNSPAIRSGGGGGGGGGEEGVGVRLHDVKMVLPTVDSIGSDSSLASPNFSPQAIVFQDASGFIDSKVVSVNLVETGSNASDHSPHTDLLSPVQVPGYILTKPIDQQLQQPPLQPPPQPQYIHPPSQSHYVTQYYPNPVPIPSYPTMYRPYVQPQQRVQYQINKPYPIYMTPVGQTQSPYDTSITDPHVPSNPVVVASPLVYEGYIKPSIPAPECAAKVYRSPAVATQPLNVHSNDHHHQVAAFPPLNLMYQPIAATHSENTNYMCEYEDPMHAQIYKTQPPGPTLPSQLQTAANAPTAMLSEAFTQLHVDNKH